MSSDASAIHGAREQGTPAVVGAPAFADGNFRVGHVFRSALLVLQRNFLLLALLGIIPKLPWILTEIGDIFPIITQIYDSLQQTGFFVGAEYIGLGDVILDVLEEILGAIADGSVVAIALQEIGGMRIDLREAFRGGLYCFLPLFVLGICLDIGRIANFFSDAFALTPALRLIIFPPLSMLLTIWFVVTPACVAERLGVFRSMARSRTLTKGHRWRIFAVLLLLSIVGQRLLKLATAIDHDAIGTAAWYVIAVLYYNVFYLVVTIAAYFHLRVAAGGLDAERVATVFD